MHWVFVFIAYNEDKSACRGGPRAPTGLPHLALLKFLREFVTNHNYSVFR